jgi:pimeloyl-ACP methyl ester carboxylesterase
MDVVDVTCSPNRPHLQVEETLSYRSYLCLARICGTLSDDGLGSHGPYEDETYFAAHITELSGADIDRVFRAQDVIGVFGSARWAFTDPANNFQGDDLEARLFHDRDFDLYYLVHRPTQTAVDNVNNAMTVLGAGIPDKFVQAAQLMEHIRPEFRDRIVLSGFSMGGALAAYAAMRAPWAVRTIVFDPLGLNRRMMGTRGSGLFGQAEVLSDRFVSMDAHVDWNYIARSWLARLNVERHLSSVGKVTELPQDPVRALNNPDTHDLRHVRFGLRQLHHQNQLGGPAAGQPAAS